MKSPSEVISNERKRNQSITPETNAPEITNTAYASAS